MKDMIKTLAISAGLIGLTAIGGMALSMAHDLAFSRPGAQPVGDERIEQVSFNQPAPGSAEAAIVTLAAAPMAAVPEAEVIPAILESTGPHNRLAGKSIVTASLNAPAAAIRPAARNADIAGVGDDFFPPNRVRQDREDEFVVAISRPVFGQRAPFQTYAASAPVASVPSAPIAAATGVTRAATPTPSFLVGVYR